MSRSDWQEAKTLLLAGGALYIQAMPLQLPPNPVAAEEMGFHFSLSQRDQQQQPLARDLADFETWLTTPVQLNRAGGPVAPRTLQNLLKHVSQYLGFLKLHLGGDNLSLLNFLNLNTYAAYVSFQRAKGNTYNTVSQQLATARKTLDFLSQRGGETASRAEAARGWLSRLNKQLATTLPQGSDMTDLSDLPAAHEIVQLIEKHKCNAYNSLPPPGQPASFETARALHDSALTCLIFGYHPPIRLVCLRTLQLPDSPKCLFGGCLKAGCRGNRLVWEDNHLTMLLNHYKVERK